MSCCSSRCRRPRGLALTAITVAQRSCAGRDDLRTSGAAQAGCILPEMAESGAIQDQSGSAGDRTDERDLVHRRIGAAMIAPPPPPTPGPQAASPVLAQGLERMRGRSDLFGFTIAPRRPVAGMRSLKRLLRRLQAQTFTHQSEFNQAATAVAQMLASEEHGARRAVHAQAAALTSAEARIAGLEVVCSRCRRRTRRCCERFEHERAAVAAGATGESDADAGLPRPAGALPRRRGRNRRAAAALHRAVRRAVGRARHRLRPGRVPRACCGRPGSRRPASIPTPTWSSCARPAASTSCTATVSHISTGSGTRAWAACSRPR